MISELIIDTHCHLDFEWFDTDRDEVIKRATESGVHKIIVPSLDLSNIQVVLNLTRQHNSVFGAVGIHPNSSAEWDESWIETIDQMSRLQKVVAIGEIGLDYYRDISPKTVQQTALETQLELAWRRDLPVILHNRDSDRDMIEMLKSCPQAGSARAGVLHSFLTTWEIAKAALELGFYLGFTGPITFKKSTVLRDVIKRAPLDRILVETDAPFLTPQAHRGKRNEPAYVTYVVEEIARIKSKSFDEIAEITSRNAQSLFGPMT